MFETNNMEPIVSDVPHLAAMTESRVKNTKKIALKSKPCVFFKDMECRAPVCDMEVCNHCPEGNAICSNMTKLSQLVKKVSMFFICLLFFADF